MNLSHIFLNLKTSDTTFLLNNTIYKGKMTFLVEIQPKKLSKSVRTGKLHPSYKYNAD